MFGVIGRTKDPIRTLLRYGAVNAKNSNGFRYRTSVDVIRLFEGDLVRELTYDQERVCKQHAFYISNELIDRLNEKEDLIMKNVDTDDELFEPCGYYLTRSSYEFMTKFEVHLGVYIQLLKKHEWIRELTYSYA